MATSKREYTLSNQLWVKGSTLTPVDKGIVLQLFESSRYTRHTETPPLWARQEQARNRPCPPQFQDDLDWLENTEFAVTLSGHVDRRVRSCRVHPTWPLNPELRGLPEIEQAFFAPNLRYPGWAIEYEAAMRFKRSEEQRANSDTDGPLPDLPPEGANDEAVLAAMRAQGLLSEPEK